MLSPLLVLATLALLTVTASAFQFPDCQSGPLAGKPICDESLPYMTRARWMARQLNVTEKVSRLINGSPAIDRLGLPAYEWWSEALHGVAYAPGVYFPDSGNFSCATSFPAPIGLGATFDRQLVYDLAQVTGTEGRAFGNNGYSGLDFWSAHTPSILRQSPYSPASTATHSPPACFSAPLCLRPGRPTSTSSGRSPPTPPSTPPVSFDHRRRFQLSHAPLVCLPAVLYSVSLQRSSLGSR